MCFCVCSREEEKRNFPRGSGQTCFHVNPTKDEEQLVAVSVYDSYVRV